MIKPKDDLQLASEVRKVFCSFRPHHWPTQPNILYAPKISLNIILLIDLTEVQGMVKENHCTERKWLFQSQELPWFITVSDLSPENCSRVPGSDLPFPDQTMPKGYVCLTKVQSGVLSYKIIAVFLGAFLWTDILQRRRRMGKKKKLTLPSLHLTKRGCTFPDRHFSFVCSEGWFRINDQGIK